MYRSLNRIAWPAIRSKVGNLRNADETGTSVIVSRIAPLRREKTDTTHRRGRDLTISLPRSTILGIRGDTVEMKKIRRRNATRNSVAGQSPTPIAGHSMKSDARSAW